jgi:hypothetical protein
MPSLLPAEAKAENAFFGHFPPPILPLALDQRANVQGFLFFMLYFYQTEPIANHQKQQTGQDRHTKVKLAQAGKAPTELSRSKLAGPESCPAEDQVKQHAKQSTATPQVE